MVGLVRFRLAKVISQIGGQTIHLTPLIVAERVGFVVLFNWPNLLHLPKLHVEEWLDNIDIYFNTSNFYKDQSGHHCIRALDWWEYRFKSSNESMRMKKKFTNISKQTQAKKLFTFH